MKENKVLRSLELTAFICFFAILNCIPTRVLGMKCPPCAKIHCQPRSAAKLDCRGGTTTGVCGCCPVCARVEGEKCGGYYNYLGKCDSGLYCEPLLKSKKGKKRKNKEPEGVCKKGKNSNIYLFFFFNSFG